MMIDRQQRTKKDHQNLWFGAMRTWRDLTPKEKRFALWFGLIYLLAVLTGLPALAIMTGWV